MEYQAKALAFRYQAQEFLASVNFLGMPLFPGLASEGDTMKLSADKIDIVVQDLGVTFVGEPEIDKNLPPAERRNGPAQSALVPRTSGRDCGPFGLKCRSCDIDTQQIRSPQRSRSTGARDAPQAERRSQQSAAKVQRKDEP